MPLDRLLAGRLRDSGDPYHVALMERLVRDHLAEGVSRMDVRALPLDLWLFRYLGLMLGAGLPLVMQVFGRTLSEIQLSTQRIIAALAQP